MTTVATPRQIGVELTKDNIPDLKKIIDDSINNKSLDEARRIKKEETWCNIGSSAQIIAGYLEDKLAELGKDETSEEVKEDAKVAAEVSK